VDVSPACRYHSSSTLLLNVSGQIAAYWEIRKLVLMFFVIHPSKNTSQEMVTIGGRNM
jgi:hypothetical protein